MTEYEGPSVEDFLRKMKQRKGIKPEQPVMDEIDELIASELDEYGSPLDDYMANRYDKCELCHSGWHGLPHEQGSCCPGAFATAEQRIAWAKRQPVSKERRALGYVDTVRNGVRYQLHLYMEGVANFVGLLVPAEPDSPLPRWSFDEGNSTLNIQMMEYDGVELPTTIGPQQLSDEPPRLDTP
jgi:hypothetical protein